MPDKARLAAIKVLSQVLPADGNGRSLRDVMTQERGKLSPAERGLMMDLGYGVCRHYRLLDTWLASQMNKPLRASARAVHLALLCGLHELWFSRRPAHAVVNTWPDICRALKAPWAAGLVNAVLRKASTLNEMDVRSKMNPAQSWSLPDWLWLRLQQSWPSDAAHIAEHLCDTAPLTVRLQPAHADEVDQSLRDASLTVTRCDFAEYGLSLIHI